MILETYAPESSCQSPLLCKDLQHSSRSWTRRGGHMRSCHPRGIGHRRRWTIVVSLWWIRWKSISWDRHAAINPTQASLESPMVGPNPTVAWVVQDSMEHFHSWLLFQPTKMPFVDLSQLLSPQIPPLFQDAGISPVWVRQETA